MNHPHKKILVLLLCIALFLYIVAAIYEKYRFLVVNQTTEEEQQELKVALTFDDGPHSIYTEKLLDGLLVRDVKATFFLIGKNIEGKEEIVKRIHEEGHLIGNHTYSHVQLACVSLEDALQEIQNTNRMIEDIIGQEVRYIRPPFGAWNHGLDENVDMQKVKWTVDPRDWSVLNAKSVADYVVREVENGDIILLHDIYKTSVEAALEIVDRLQEKGYKFVTLDELVLPSSESFYRIENSSESPIR